MAVPIDSGVASKPHVKAAAKYIQSQFGVSNIGGSATTGHIPTSDHYKGLALDAMIGSDVQKGNAIATWAISRPDVTYVIWNRRIFDKRSGGGWGTYRGTSPHTTHVHISFKETGSGENIVGGGSATSSLNPVDALIGKLLDPIKESALRVVTFLAGLVVLIIGVILWRRTQ